MSGKQPAAKKTAPQGEPVLTVTFTVHNARQIVPPTAPGVPDTLCGVELIGPEHLSKKMVHSECALPGSFFEPTVYDYTIEWELYAEHLEESRSLYFSVAICYESAGDTKSAFGGSDVDFVPLCICRLPLLRVLEKAVLDNYQLKTTTPEGDPYNCLVEYSAFTQIKSEAAMSVWRQKLYGLHSSRAAQLMSMALMNEPDAPEVDERVKRIQRMHDGLEDDDDEPIENALMRRRGDDDTVSDAGSHTTATTDDLSRDPGSFRPLKLSMLSPEARDAHIDSLQADDDEGGNSAEAAAYRATRGAGSLAMSRAILAAKPKLTEESRNTGHGYKLFVGSGGPPQVKTTTGRKRPLRALLALLRDRLTTEALRRFWTEAPPVDGAEMLHGMLFRLPRSLALSPNTLAEFNSRARFLWDSQFRAGAPLAGSQPVGNIGGVELHATLYDFAMAELVECFPALSAPLVPSKPLMSVDHFAFGMQKLQPVHGAAAQPGSTSRAVTTDAAALKKAAMAKTKAAHSAAAASAAASSAPESVVTPIHTVAVPHTDESDQPKSCVMQ